jgi:hypothetical protein
VNLTDLSAEISVDKGDALIARMEDAKKGKVRLSKADLQLIALAAYGDAYALLNSFPAEGVPPEIENEWRELRAILPLQEKISDYLNDVE